MFYLETISARAFVQISNCEYITAVGVKSGLIIFVDFYSLYCLLFYDKQMRPQAKNVTTLSYFLLLNL